MGRPILACALAAAAALGVGCAEREEPVGNLRQTYPVVVRGAGDQPTVAERPPNRIVALDPGPAEIIAALGATDALVGVPSAFGGDDGTEVVTVAGHVKVDAVTRLKPDLVVGTPAVDPLDIARAAREADAAAYVQPAASVTEVQRGVIELGFLLGKPTEARRIVARMRRAIAEIEARLADQPAVPVFIDTGFRITVSDHSLPGDLVRRARGRSVAGRTPGPEPFDPCDVVRLGAEVVLSVTERGQRTPRSEFAACPGGENIRIAAVPSKLALEAGPRLAEALEAVARALHPNALS